MTLSSAGVDGRRGQPLRGMAVHLKAQAWQLPLQ